MGLHSTLATALHGVVARVRRNLIVYGICAISAVAVLILATRASVLALVPVVGAVYAELIVAGFFVLIMLAALAWQQLAQPQAKPSAAAPLAFEAQDNPQGTTRFAQIAMIVEAVLLGYSLSRRR